MTVNVRLLGLLAAALAAWCLFAPPLVGGSVTYVSTTGISMEPGVHAGDLVLARQQDNYQIGDAIAYHSDSLGVTVLHRIVDLGPDGFVTKGDNNDWLDPDTPTADQIYGAEWIHIPQGGIWLQRLTSPLVLAGLLAIVLWLGSATLGRRQRGRERRRTMGSTPMAAPQSDSLRTMAGGNKTDLFRIGVGVALLGLLVCLFAWTRPTTGQGFQTVDVDQVMTFSYSATVPRSPAYQSTTVTSPQTVFRSQSEFVDVTYAYEGEPGSIKTVAELSTASGWNWTLPLNQPQEAPDGILTGTASLDLRAIEKRAVAGTNAAGIAMGDVTVTVVPIVTTATGEFRPELPLTLSSESLSLAGEPDTLAVRQTSQQDTSTPTANSLTVLGFSIGVWPARLIGLLLLLAGVGAALWARALPDPAPAEQALASQRRHHELIVPVTTVPTSTLPVIDVPDVDSLVRLAKRYALLIFHWSDSAGDVYFVQDETAMYRCVVPSPVSRFDPTQATDTNLG